MTDSRNSEGGAAARGDRERFLGQKGCVVWLTGLSGSGKTTLARALECRLASRGRLCYVLDGDTVRQGLNSDLGFSPKDRAENVRRVGEVAALFADAGLIAVAAFISPYRADRRNARACVPPGRFLEVFLSAPVDVCAARDPKGLYAAARNGLVASFTGVSAPYEVPEHPELILDTGNCPVEACAGEILRRLELNGLIPPEGAGGAEHA
jgi:adenylylsulfate kinase